MTYTPFARSSFHGNLPQERLFAPLEQAERTIARLREAIKRIYGIARRAAPVWVNDDSADGWEGTCPRLVDAVLGDGGVEEDTPGAIKIAYVQAGQEVIAEIRKPGTDFRPLVQRMIATSNVAMDEARVYEGNRRVLSQRLRMRCQRKLHVPRNFRGNWVAKRAVKPGDTEGSPVTTANSVLALNAGVLIDSRRFRGTPGELWRGAAKDADKSFDSRRLQQFLSNQDAGFRPRPLFWWQLVWQSHVQVHGRVLSIHTWNWEGLPSAVLACLRARRRSIRDQGRRTVKDLLFRRGRRRRHARHRFQVQSVPSRDEAEMAIQHLKVQGFRSLKEISWKPGRLNLLVGQNGAGKSNLLRLFEFVANAAKGQLSETIRRAGGIVPLLWDHKGPSLGWKVRLDPPERGRDRVRDAVTYDVTLQQLGSGSSYEINYDMLAKPFEAETGIKPKPFKFFEQDPRHKVVFDSKQKRLVIPPEKIDENESLLSQVSDPLTYPVITAVKRSIEMWRIHHDVHVERGSAMRSAATTQHTRLVAADGSNLATVLHTLYTGARETRLSIDEGMRAAFGNEYEELVFQPAAAQQIQLAVQWRSSRQPHVGEDLSDGTLRFLFLLTVLASPDAAPLVAIDEPETGLHPSMLPIIAEYAGAAAQKTQVYLTSHSPEFLDAFNDLAPQIAVCHWEQGQTQVYTLGPDRMKDWLDKYRLGRMFTSGELELLAAPDVETSEEHRERIKRMPAEDEAPRSPS